MRFFITGGAGYIGSHVVQLLREHGHEVVVFDNLTTGHREAVPAAVRLIEGDLLDLPALRAALAETKADAVMHFAGLALVGDSMKDPGSYFRVNVQGGLNLLEAMLTDGPRRLVLSSTCATYGVPATLPISEDMPTAPLNPYGESKLMFERAFAWFQQVHGFSGVVFRYFNAAGCWGGLGEDHEPETHLIPNVLRAASGRLPAIEIYGTDYPTPDGTCLRDFIHVRDVAAAHLLAVESGISGTYNLGTGRAVSVREVIDTCKLVTGRDIGMIVRPRRGGDPPALFASAAKAERELGWHPVNSDLTSMIRDAWVWMAAHPDGYAPASL
jgi:UDP-glucose 4-epimerase